MFARNEFKKADKDAREYILPNRDSLNMITKGYLPVLEKLNTLSDFSQGSKSFVVAHLPYRVNELKKTIELLLVDRSLPSICHMFAQNVLTSIKSRLVDRYINQSSMSLCAALFHPWYGAKRLLEFVPKSVIENSIAMIKDQMTIVSALEKKDTNGTLDDPNISSLFASSAPDSIELKEREFNQLLLKHQHLIAAEQALGKFNIDFVRGYETNWSPCPVQQMYLNSGIDPLLKRVARHFFSCPATIATGERYFSAAGLVNNSLKGRFNDSSIEMITFLHYWIARASEKDCKDFELRLRRGLENPVTLRRWLLHAEVVLKIFSGNHFHISRSQARF
jgi:hypothetical protein